MCDTLRDLVPLVQCKKREKHPWMIVTFRKFCSLKLANFTKSNTPPWVFFTFFKLYEWYQIAQHITYSRNTLIYGLNFVLQISLNLTPNDIDD